MVAVSFDPRETPEMAREKKATIVKEYNRPGSENGWHFLTGSEDASKAIWQTRSAFTIAYDSMTNQYAHASGDHSSDAGRQSESVLLRHRLSGPRRPAGAGRGFGGKDRVTDGRRCCCIASTTIRQRASTDW